MRGSICRHLTFSTLGSVVISPRRTGSAGALGLLFVFLASWTPGASAEARSLEDWQLLHNYLRQQINQHADKYPTGNLKFPEPYVQALQIFAKDRDEARRAAQEAQASTNLQVKQFFDKFMDLVDRAQAEGNAVLEESQFLFRVEEDDHDRIDWATLCIRADTDGKVVYNNAAELMFDQGIVRGHIRIMLETALKDLDTGWSLMAGSGYVGWLYPTPMRAPFPQADEGLSWVQQVRELANYFKLPAEYDAGTQLMNRYLKDALCLLDKGHQWYVDLAEKYGLADSLDYIRGFYATLYGKVELQTKSGRKPARGAKVIARDPHDNRTWETKTNDNGDYELSGPILHNACSPFEVSAHWKGCETKSEYIGPLTKPDRSKRHKVDLLIVPSITGSFEIVDDLLIAPKEADIKLTAGSEHSVRFSVDFEQDPPKIEGEGNYRVVQTLTAWGPSGGVEAHGKRGEPVVWVFPEGLRCVTEGPKGYDRDVVSTAEGITDTQTGDGKRVLYGELIDNEKGEPRLNMGFVQTNPDGTTSKFGPPVSFPLVDGHTVKQQIKQPFLVSGVSGGVTITLHLDKR